MALRLLSSSFREMSSPTPNASAARVAMINPSFGGLKAMVIMADLVHITMQAACAIHPSRAPSARDAMTLGENEQGDCGELNRH